VVDENVKAEVSDQRLTCPGCGTEQSAASGLCLVCGKRILEGFQPLDTIKSSHGLQGRRLTIPSAPVTPELFGQRNDGYAGAAWACTVYSMVPYLGILFVPFAIGVGAVGYAVTRGAGEPVRDRKALLAIGVSLVILMVQIVLWWLLYLIPEIGI
jgi:hypothetical protein